MKATCVKPASPLAENAFLPNQSGKLGKELAEVKEWLPKFYPTVLQQYEATCRGERDLFF